MLQPSPVPKPLPPVVIKEIPEMYKPLEWLAQTVPRKAPYCPQIGDEVVYFKQGHLLYLEAVKNKKLYEVNPKDIPWNKCEIKVLICGSIFDEFYNYSFCIFIQIIFAIHMQLHLD